MKVLIVDRTTTAIGGIKTYVSNLESLLKERGYDVVIYSTKHSIIDKWLIGGVRYFINKIYRPYGIVIDAVLFSWLARWIIPESVDFTLYQSLAIHKDGKRSASVVHALWSDNLQGSFLSTGAVSKCMAFERRLLTNEKYCMFTVSDAYAEHIARVHQCKSLPVIENFLNENFESMEWSYRDIDIVYTGQFNPRKNLLFLLNIVRNIHERNNIEQLSVLLIGSGPSELEIKEYIRIHSLSNVVQIINNPSRESIKKFLSRSKIFMLPSVKESFSYSLLEAKLSDCITFAHDDLEIPKGFVDVRMRNDHTMDIIETLEMILKAESTPSEMKNKEFSNPVMQAGDKIKKLLDSGCL